MHKKVFAIAIVALFYMPLLVLSETSRDEVTLFSKIESMAKKKDAAAIANASDSFVKKYPKSAYLPEIILIKSDCETDAKKALSGYSSIVKRFPSFRKNDYVLYRISELWYLLPNDKELLQVATRGIALFQKSAYRDQFSFFLVHANYNSGNYSKAKSIGINLMENNHNQEMLSKTLLYLAYIENKISGYSRDYITILSNHLLGFPESEESPSVLFLIGKFYEYKKMHNHAYSSYSDCIVKFPHSPEAATAQQRIALLKDTNPHKVDYIPDKTLIASLEKIDIAPDVPLHEEENGYHFSVSIGPLDSKSRMHQLKTLLKEFDTIAVRITDGYVLYVGTCADTDEALSLKTRLAEEYGINGGIVRISSTESIKYIYGE